jgi:hypothetical protein
MKLENRRRMIWNIGFVLVCVLLLGAGCRADSTTELPLTPRGVSLSPDSTASQPFADFFERATTTGSYISWAGSVTDLTKSNGAPNVLVRQTTKSHQHPIIIVSPSAADVQTTTSWDAWSAPILAFLETHNIPYIGIGNELNKTFSKKDFTLYEQRFASIVKIIHALSPTTNVFPIFQYEWMIGMRGGLFGGVNDATKADWLPLYHFPSADLIAFTSYPSLVYHARSEIPETYYSKMTAYTTATIAFTEIGWARSGPKGWENSAEEQAEFIRVFFDRTASLKTSWSLWAFLFDPKTATPFSSMGLLQLGQSESPALTAWKK